MGLKSVAVKNGPAVNHVRLEDGYAGMTDGVDVWVDDRLNGIQLTCTLLHELIHIERGHTGHQTEVVEMGVRYETARRLLPLDRLVGTCKEAATLGEAAEALSVTRYVLMDRSAFLSDQDVAAVGCQSCRKCPAMQFRFSRP